MKTLLLAAFLVFAIRSAFAQADYPLGSASTAKELSLNGPVSKMIEYHFYDRYNDNDTTGRRWYTIFEFDRNGKLLSERSYSGKGHLLTKDAFNYSKKDSIDITQIDAKGEKIKLTELVYDSQGQLIESNQYSPPFAGIAFRKSLKYDESGHNTLSITYFGIKTQAGRDTFVYNSQNQKIELLTETFHHSADFKDYFKYDRNGHLISENIAPASDSSFMSMLMAAEIHYGNFDKYGNWLKKVYLQHTDRAATDTVAGLLKKGNLPVGKDVLKDKPEIITRKITYFE